MSVTNLRKLSLERALLRLLEFRHGIPALVTLIAILTLATACAVLHLADRPFDTDLASLLPLILLQYIFGKLVLIPLVQL